MTQTDETKTIAIIGGGQLGYLLCEAARRLGMATLVVTPDPAAPALRVADEAMMTELDTAGLARRIAERCHAVTFEFESVPDTLLAELEAQQREGHTVVHPDPAVLRLVKNKATQKQWLMQQGLPTQPFLTAANPQSESAEILQKFPLPVVQKAQQGGYDGYGVQVISSYRDLDKLWAVPSIIEPFLAGVRELAVLTVRSTTGEIQIYEPVELEFDGANNILAAAIAPAQIPAKLRAEAMELARTAVDRLGGVGVFAIEMFVTADERLLINEISPRVHNSGHHTLDACESSQFEQHVRAVAGLALGSTAQLSTAVMKNILYAQEWAHLSTAPSGVMPTGQPDVTFYWYGKNPPRPGRKMGHVTCAGASRSLAEQRISLALTELQAAGNEGYA